MKLQDRIALITGAGRNIGRAMALAFAREGADVIVNVRQNRQEAERVVEEVRRLGRRAIPIVADVADREQVRAMVSQALEGFGRIDIAVSNAAIRPGKPFLELTLEDWRRVMAVNLEGGFFLSQAVLSGMVARRRGSLIFMAGLAGWGLRSQRAHVSASKAAVVGLAKALATEFAPYGVRSNVISPGVIKTTRPAEWYLQRPDAAEEMARVPLGRLGEVEDIAHAAVFLASDDSAYVTGQVLFINGGSYWQ